MGMRIHQAKPYKWEGGRYVWLEDLHDTVQYFGPWHVPLDGTALERWARVVGKVVYVNN